MYHVYGGGFTPRKKRTMEAERLKANKDKNHNVGDQQVLIVQDQKTKGAGAKKQKSLDEEEATGYSYIQYLNSYIHHTYATFRKRVCSFAK